MAQPNHERDREIAAGEERLYNLRKRVLATALGYVGAKSIKYTSPEMGTDPNGGFDCSGFIVHTFESALREEEMSDSIPRHANEQWRELGESVAFSQRQPADLIYFASRKKGKLWVVGHVGLVLDALRYIHAPGKDNTQVCVEQIPQEQEPLPSVDVNDLYTHNPVGIKRFSLPLGDGRWRVF
jgi:hypothetical protein